MATETITTPRVWMGCLACYNAGNLVGEWVDASTAADCVSDPDWCVGVHGPVLAADEPVSSHEEWWVMDHEGLPISGECSPATAQAWGELLDQVGEDLRGAFLAWVECGNYSQDVDGLPLVSDFEEAYEGEWSSRRDFAEELADNYGYAPTDNDVSTNPLRRYIDWDSWTHDLFMMDYYAAPAYGYGVYVFRSY